MHILITGGAGFIGSNLADSLLTQGHKITVIDNFNNYYNPEIKEHNIAHNIDNPNYKLYRSDIEDLSTLKSIFAQNKFDVVVHLAARAGVRPSLENPIAYVKTNIEGTVNILECMKEYNVKKLVFASSSSVYGNCKSTSRFGNYKIYKPHNAKSTNRYVWRWHNKT